MLSRKERIFGSFWRFGYLFAIEKSSKSRWVISHENGSFSVEVCVDVMEKPEERSGKLFSVVIASVFDSLYSP